jgi:RES domain-containing protein
MAALPDWDAATAIATCQAGPWRGSAWRAHRRKYRADDPGGSLLVSGRYNRGLDQFSAEDVWPALYLALGAEICLGEILRHISPLTLPQLNDYRLSELTLELASVLDCRDASRLGLSLDHLCADADYGTTQALAAAALTREAEAILVPSCTRLGDNLIVFPTHLQHASRLTIVSSRDPQLYVSH